LFYTAPVIEERPTPCSPTPCGSNAVCREQNGAGSCTCLPDYVGNPYEGCRPECVLNTDCAPNRACIRNKCQDPCPGTCGQNADCQVVNHLPSCTCHPGYTGDPFKFCNNLPPERKLLQHNIFILCHNFLESICYITFIWRNYLTVILTSFLFLFFSCKTRTRRSLCTISMWIKQSVSKCEWTSSMLLPTYLYRQSTRLSTRVCCELRMCTEQSMCEPEMCGPVSRNMWTKCSLWSDQPQSNLQLSDWVYWRSIHKMFHHST